MLTAVENPDADCDISIYSGSFSEPMDISMIAVVRLDGVYYPIG
ncbi:MAG: hypothetical protein ACI4JB_00565 [Porcipelethomonas sp.]